MTISGFFTGTGMPDSGWWEALWPDPLDVLVRAGLKPGVVAVDLCAGDGWFTLPMARLARAVTAIDIDAALLERAKRRVVEAGLTNTRFVHGDAFDIASLLQGTVDFVFLANAFHGVPDKTRLAAEVKRVLKPGGLFAIVNWHARPREATPLLGEPRGPASDLRMTPEATIAAVTASGLMHSATIEVPPYHYAAIFSQDNPTGRSEP